MTEPVFQKVPTTLDFPREEREMLELWKKGRIFEQSLELREGRPSFVFYEGPPTANGMPHNGSVLTRVIKDLFPRYKTMRGFRVPRKAGWDTHGLPVEVEVEKELRIHGKAAIEDYGVEPFIAKCIDSVFRYTDEWEKLTERIGFWVDLKQAYVTYHQSYVESVWWALSELFKKGLLYQGHKVVWWWAQGGTALSAGEVGLGYREVFDPSVYVAFPLVDDSSTSLLVWTTTPWTLPSNAYAAVNTGITYVKFSIDGKNFIAAKDLATAFVAKLKKELVVEKEYTGNDLIGLAYRPPFDLYEKSLSRADVPYWKVIAADFVTLDAGTGIVHIAPAFGEDDFNAHREVLKGIPNGGSVPLLCAVKPDGTFVDDFGRYKGRWVKSCDKDLQEELKQRGLLLFAEQYRHEYPFCWRSDQDPLIQFARPAWYIRTTEKIQQAIANNQAVEWLPPHIKDGRFGDFLANNVDWALSRERYWGTPLNIWINDATGKMEAPSSVREILAKNAHAFDHFHEAKRKTPSLSEHLIVHKPWIDQVTWQNPGEEGTYRRVPDVIDCWFDSGCMPFAQWGYPHAGRAEFEANFPANFISEGIDQTRGWFYTLLMISTLVFDEESQKKLGLPATKFPHPFERCVVLGHVCDSEGKKESKSKGNYTPPDLILDAVKMEFAVLSGPSSKAGICFVAREDLDGMDLHDGAEVRATSAVDATKSVTLKIHAAKGLARRVVVLDPSAQSALGVVATTKTDVKPVEVPRLPAKERVLLEDPHSAAPGADAFRWFFYASNPPWNSTRHSLANVRALQKETLIKLRNVYSFFVIYAGIDGFDPLDPPAERLDTELDRWILELLAETNSAVTTRLDGYDIYGSSQAIAEFVDALSNWYVRRSRARFWGSGRTPDKESAHRVLYECLVTLAKILAPFTPFLAETLYQNLVVNPARRRGQSVPASVHLVDFPALARVESDLPQQMASVRSVVHLGLQVRTQAKVKVRQPLRCAKIIASDARQRESLRSHVDMIREELNVLDVDFVEEGDVRKFVEYKLKPNFRTLGQRGLGKVAQELKKTMAEMSDEASARLQFELMRAGSVELAGTKLLTEDVEVAFSTKEGFAAAGGRVGVVILETALDDELRNLGLFRELLNRVQNARKEEGLEFSDRIRLTLGATGRLAEVIERWNTELAKEVLAVQVDVRDPAAVAQGVDIDVEGEKGRLHVARA